MTLPTAADVAQIAREVVEARRRGDTSPVIHDVTFDTEAGGWCLRFVWRCFCSALRGAGVALDPGDPGGDQQLAWLPWAARYAVDACRVLARGGDSLCGHFGKVSSPEPGDIALLTASGTRPGHIALLVSPTEVAENTVAGRGNPPRPGTKITPLREVEYALTGFARVLPSTAPGPAQPTVIGPDGNRIAAGAFLGDDGSMYAQVRALAEGLGCRVDATQWPVVKLTRPPA
jgi:hypothetical protein